ncbi:MAG: SRPBCC domain-containing protein [Actinomycetes bacterium]
MIGQTRITRRSDPYELVVERTFEATPARLWRCWTTPEVTRWWGPRGWTAVVHEMDVRIGGTWRYSIAPEAGDEQPVHCAAVYRRIEEPAVLAFDDGFVDESGELVADATLPITVTIDRRDGGTHLTITTRYTDAEHLATAETSGMDTGLAEALDRLGEHIDHIDL